MKKMMKFYGTIILATMIFSNVTAKSLKETTEEFTNLITQTALTSSEFINQLKPYIDPAANVDSVCMQYYTYWKDCLDNSNYPHNTKIESIKKDSKNSANVLISNIWHIPSDGDYYFVTETSWVKKNNNWYRTPKSCEILTCTLVEPLINNTEPVILEADNSSEL